MFNPKHNYKDFLAGALLGGTLGAMTAMMLRTSKGKKLQKELLGKFKKLGGKADLLKEQFLKEAMKDSRVRTVRKALKKVAKKRRPLKKRARRRAG